MATSRQHSNDADNGREPHTSPTASRSTDLAALERELERLQQPEENLAYLAAMVAIHNDQPVVGSPSSQTPGHRS